MKRPILRLTLTCLALSSAAGTTVAFASPPGHPGDPDPPRAEPTAAGTKPPDAVSEPAPMTLTLEQIGTLIKNGHLAGAEAAARALLTVVETEKGEESAEGAEVLSVLVVALQRGGKVREPQTREAAERAVHIREKVNGPESAETASALVALGAVLQATSKFAEAKSTLERALSIREKTLGPDDPGVAETLANLAGVLDAQGDYPGARERLERALVIREKSQGADSYEVSVVLNSLGNILRKLGDNQGARDRYERALAIREVRLGPDDPQVARSLSNLGMIHQVMGDLEGARPLLERALSIREKAFGPDHKDVAASLFSLGNLLLDMGDVEGSRANLERALAIRQRTLGPDDPLLAESLNSLGGVHKEHGDLPRARAYDERALAIRMKIYGPDNPEVAKSLNNLGTVAHDMGDHEAARSYYERALSIRESRLGKNHADVARTLNNLGNLMRDTGQLSAARPIYDRALAIREESLGKENPEVANTLVSICLLELRASSHREARPSCERALAIREKVLGMTHPITAEAVYDLASVFEAAGDLDAAKARYERSLAIWESTLGPSHPRLAQGLGALAALHLRVGDVSRAFDESLRMERIARQHFRATARSLSEREALSYEEIRSSGLGVLLSAARSSDRSALPPAASEQAWDETIRSRAMVLDEMASRHRSISGTIDGESARLTLALTSARRRLAHLALSGSDVDRPEEYRSELTRAREDVDRAERALAQVSLPFRQELALDRTGFGEIVSALPPSSALVAYVKHRRFGSVPRPRTASSAGAEESAYLAFVVSSEVKRPLIVPLGSAAGIDALVDALRTEMLKGPAIRPSGDRENEARFRTAAGSLREAIWDPLAGSLQGTKLVFIVPDGGLNLVSFATLPIGRDRYLGEEGAVIHYLSAERDLVRDDPRVAAARGVLALGAPDFDARSTGELPGLASASRPGPAAPVSAAVSAPVYRSPGSSCGEIRSLRFDPLPGTSAEVDDVFELWTRAAKKNGGGGGSGDSTKLSGATASETAFKRLAPGHRIVHVATHGYFAAGACDSTGKSTRSSPTAGSTSAPAARTESPLLLTGLALAGANRRNEPDGKPDSEDGMLSAEEVASLDLSGVEWVVLSACETGVGKIMEGEGVLGLRRAFETAGAGSLIMSLWAVDDRSTWEWMRDLYRERLKGLGTAEAVRAANVSMLAARRRKGASTHPFYWGGFVAAGDWR